MTNESYHKPAHQGSAGETTRVGRNSGGLDTMSLLHREGGFDSPLVPSPFDIHAQMDAERAAHDVEPAPSETVWKERTYQPWGVTSKKSRRRAKHARQKAIRAWQQRQRDK